jgi:hypothetical protein
MHSLGIRTLPYSRSEMPLVNGGPGPWARARPFPPVNGLPALTLSLSCGKCRHEASVVFSDAEPAASKAARPAEWACPHCGRSNQLPAIGRVWSVSARP